MKILKIRPVKTPQRGTPQSAGIDFYVPDNFPKSVISPGHSLNIPSGIHAKIPEGHVLVLMDKSGVCTKMDLIVGACVVDEDYQGEIHLHVINVGKYCQWITPGQKLVQGILLPVNYATPDVVDSLEELYKGVKTVRGANGFGSTGK